MALIGGAIEAGGPAEVSGRADAPPLPAAPDSADPAGVQDHGDALVPDWANSLHFVRRVAERVREAQHQSNIAADDARQAARDALVAMWAAQERAQLAEAEAAAALARAEKAEEQLRRLTSHQDDGGQAGDSVDRWLNQAYRQLRMAREKRSDSSGG